MTLWYLVFAITASVGSPHPVTLATVKVLTESHANCEALVKLNPKLQAECAAVREGVR
jgi:hypothetical protein